MNLSPASPFLVACGSVSLCMRPAVVAMGTAPAFPLSTFAFAANIAPPSNEIRGRVWTLSQDPEGSRAVQHAFEDADAKERESLARELQGHIADAMQCPHANHVLQKCTSLLEPEFLQMFIDEIAREGPQAI